MASDRRTRYTKAAIRDALFTLLKEKPLSKVTVTDICKLADINRSTFYSYYEDVNALMTQIQNDVFQDVLITITNENWFDDLLNLVDKNKDLFQVLIGPHGDTDFIRQLLYLGYDNSIRFWAKTYPNATPTEMDYAFAYISNGVIGILENWIFGGYKESLDEVGRILYGLSMYGIGFLNGDKPQKSEVKIAPLPN